MEEQEDDFEFCGRRRRVNTCFLCFFHLSVLLILCGIICTVSGILCIVYDSLQSVIGHGIWGGAILIICGLFGLLLTFRTGCINISFIFVGSIGFFILIPAAHFAKIGSQIDGDYATPEIMKLQYPHKFNGSAFPASLGCGRLQYTVNVIYYSDTYPANKLLYSGCANSIAVGANAAIMASSIVGMLTILSCLLIIFIDWCNNVSREIVSPRPRYQANPPMAAEVTYSYTPQYSPVYQPPPPPPSYAETPTGQFT